MPSRRLEFRKIYLVHALLLLAAKQSFTKNFASNLDIPSSSNAVCAALAVISLFKRAFDIRHCAANFSNIILSPSFFGHSSALPAEDGIFQVPIKPAPLPAPPKQAAVSGQTKKTSNIAPFFKGWTATLDVDFCNFIFCNVHTCKKYYPYHVPFPVDN
jgi:hypothetical protein